MPRRLLIAGLLSATALPAVAQDFPQTFPNRYGEAVVEAAPDRVVSLGFSSHDNLLALGVTPVALRYWYGDDPFGVWPWAQDALGDAQPEVLKGDLNIEQIAALEPDLIYAVGSGVTAEQYALLSRIAPTILPAPDYSDYGTPWQERALSAGRATGHLSEAEEQVAAIEARIDEAAAGHPDWQGQSAAVAYYWNGAPGAYRSIDSRAQLLGELGFATPAEIDAAGAEDSFFATLSNEDLTPLDTDLLVWVVDGDMLEEVGDLSLRKTLDAHVEGRELYADERLSSAFSHATLLSLPEAIERLVPLIEKAVDGEPATPVDSTVAAGLAP